MAAVLPMTLSGDTLGQRHRYLNLQVNEFASTQISFKEIEVLPEETAVDRLFKIDLAIKLKNFDYILKTLKDDDMLYVSRALKCKSLLERRDIINPKYLEDAVYPEMIMPAVSKMKHWLHNNLKHDPLSCQDFYLHYKNIVFEYAIKFLYHCPNDFVIEEFPELLTKITPHDLKIFADKNSHLVKIYFDALATNVELVKQYLKSERKFYDSIKCVMKSDPDLFFDILEKYHNINLFPRLSPSATEYVLRYQKQRFLAKLELYVVRFVHIPTMALRLSSEECQEVVISLARANYIQHWFSYAVVEPLVKRIDSKDRAAFKKRVFVDKDIGETIDEWPYEYPEPPVGDTSDVDQKHIFYDENYVSISMPHTKKICKRLIKRKCGKWAEICQVKSELQKLFDEFRFKGFKASFHELKDRLRTVSSADRRRDMLIVLVSKSGGHAENVHGVLQLAHKQRNEPVHIRAAVVRSLVKRSNAWRLPENTWNMLLEYGVGLGLDGSKPEAECREGLHAVVLRQLLSTSDCDPIVGNAFLDNFSTMSEYKLTASERMTVSIGLQRMLMTAATNAEPEIAANYLYQLLDVFGKYHINVKLSSIVSAVEELANRDPIAARPLLERLYKDRVGRRELLRHNLAFKCDDSSFINILRHDLKALEPEWFIELLISNKLRANQFLSKLAVYFNESGGAAEIIRTALQNKVNQDLEVKLARPLTILSSGTYMLSMLNKEDKTNKKHCKFTIAVWANIHKSRPAPDVLTLGWRKVGLKAFASRAMRCRQIEVKQIVEMLLQEGVKRPVRLALALAQRTDCAADFFTTAVEIRPLSVLRAALLYFRHMGNKGDPQIWNLIKRFLPSVDLQQRKGLRHILLNIGWIPNIMKPNYCAMLYLALDKISDRFAERVLQDIMKYLPEISDDLLDEVLLRSLDDLDNRYPESNPTVIIRYLMISKNVDQQKSRFEIVAEPFLRKIFEFRCEEDNCRHNFFFNNCYMLVMSLRYNYAFFDINNQNCIPVTESILKWMQTFLARDIHFKWYVNVHTTMLYYKAVRQSVKQNPEIFQNNSRKMTEGVEIVGFIFGRYMSKEVSELKEKYFDSVVSLYSRGYIECLQSYYMNRRGSSKFIAAIIKGIITENKGSEAFLGIQVLEEYQSCLDNNMMEEIKELTIKTEDKAAQMFMFALLSD